MQKKLTAYYQKHLTPQTGKTVLITGGNSGLGFAAAKGFLTLGATVILACRHEGRAQKALGALLAEFPQGNVSSLPLDLADFESIDRFITLLKEKTSRLDTVLHCAGVYYPNVAKTKDGLPTTLGVNYAGTAYLARLLLPLLDGEGRMIFTTSLTDRFGKRQTLQTPPEKEGYPGYAASKTLLSALTLRLAERRLDTEPHFIAMHPGITATDLLSAEKTTHKPLFSRLGHAFLYGFVHRPDKAVLGALLAACHGQNGECFGPRGPFGISGFPRRTKFCGNVRKLATRPLPFDGTSPTEVDKNRLLTEGLSAYFS
jgi:NAD(P)-dependent dehydrogenase (short-subunit alcohol dehydrogenase family)